MPKTEAEIVFNREMYKFFEVYKYPSKWQKEQLAAHYGKSVNTISNWFNRRRHNEKKRKTEMTQKTEVINFLDTIKNQSGSTNDTIDRMREKIMNSNSTNWSFLFKQKTKAIHDVLRDQILQRQQNKPISKNSIVSETIDENTDEGKTKKIINFNFLIFF